MDAEVMREQCSNAGRWGKADDRGTLNFIDAEVRLRAVGMVKSGRTVTTGRELGPRSRQHMMLFHNYKSEEIVDYVGIACHGYDITHLDALGHVFHHDRTYNGRGPEIVLRDRLADLSVGAYADGIVTRGVLLDLPRVLGVDALEAGHYVTVTELERAERELGVVVGRGDALFVRTGKTVRETQRVRPTADAPWPGLAAECVPWLHAREIALYTGDCVERLPGPDPALPLPLHQIGLCAMGLCLLDWSDVEPLAAACADERRWDFLTVVSPLRLPGVTGCAVNPVCIF